MSKILYILKHNAWGIGGGSYASRSYLEAFTNIFNSYEIDLCLCEEYVSSMQPNSIEKYNIIGIPPRPSISRYFSFITGELHRYTVKVKELLKDNKYTYVVFDHNSIAGTLVKAAKANGAKTITLHHNHEPEYYRDNTTNFLERNLMLPHVVKTEKLAYIKSDYNIFLTEEDLSLFSTKYGVSEGKCNVIGSFEFKDMNINLPIDIYNKPDDKIKIVVTGSLSNVQNTDGILYLFKSLYKYIPENCTLLLAGKNPTDEIITLASQHKNVTLIANPLDMSEVIANADIYLCTTRLGSGIKIRIMDGLRLGLPVLTHKVSSRGYTTFEKNHSLFVFTNKEEFKEKLETLLTEIQNGKINKDQIRKIYDKQFSFKAGLNRLKSFILN